VKLDWDIIRSILTELEAKSPGETRKLVVSISRDDKSEDKQLHIAHLFLLREAGFIKGSDSSTFSGKSMLAPELTWEGHQLLADIKSDKVWTKTKEIAQEKGVDLSFEAVKKLAKIALDMIIGG
jgi:hypothetical protein